jgi:hypothetical protein
LGCTGLYHLDKEYVEARGARVRLCEVMEDYDRQARPWLYPWLNGEKQRPVARRAKRQARVMPLSAPSALRAAA